MQALLAAARASEPGVRIPRGGRGCCFVVFRLKRPIVVVS